MRILNACIFSEQKYYKFWISLYSFSVNSFPHFSPSDTRILLLCAYKSLPASLSLSYCYRPGRYTDNWPVHFFLLRPVVWCGRLSSLHKIFLSHRSDKFHGIFCKSSVFTFFWYFSFLRSCNSFYFIPPYIYTDQT